MLGRELGPRGLGLGLTFRRFRSKVPVTGHTSNRGTFYELYLLSNVEVEEPPKSLISMIRSALCSSCVDDWIKYQLVD